jgi:ATP-dependent Lon protease
VEKISKKNTATVGSGRCWFQGSSFLEVMKMILSFMDEKNVVKNRNLVDKGVSDLKNTINKANLPIDLNERLSQMIFQLEMVKSSENFLSDFQKTKDYIDWTVSLPWEKSSQDNLDIEKARKTLVESHYGLDEIKTRILEYLSVLILQNKRGNQDMIRAPILCFVGLVGTGKTTIAKSIAKALGREFVRIPFGGLGDPFYLRGRSRFYPYAEPGQVIKGLRQVQTNNPVILLDEIDRVADDALNTIMGVLVELLDPEQNWSFTDHYLDYPFDLSKVLFVATANNTNRIATAVLDRIEPISMPSYSDKEKIIIGKDYILPEAISRAGLDPSEVSISDDVWGQIVRPLGFDAGVRTLQRNIEGICRKAAYEIVQGKKEKIFVNKENVKEYVPAW